MIPVFGDADDYPDDFERRPPTVKCAHCGNPVELKEADTYRVTILCRTCREAQ